MPIAITIGDTTFKTLKAATAHFRGLLDKDSLSPEEEKQVRLLAQRMYPIKDDEEVGFGRHPFYKSKCFKVGGREFSYKICLTRKVKTPLDKVMRAMRYSIHRQIIQFKTQEFDGKCELTGEDLKWEDADVDHKFDELTFNKMAHDFATSIGLDSITDICIEKDEKRGVYLIIEPQIDKAWKEYHKEHAKLRIIRRDLN